MEWHQMTDPESDKQWDRWKWFLPRSLVGRFRLDSTRTHSKLFNERNSSSDWRTNRSATRTSEDRHRSTNADRPISPSSRISSSSFPSKKQTSTLPIRLAPRNQLDENPMQQWLNHKFPHGFQTNLEKASERLDTTNAGNVPSLLLPYSPPSQSLLRISRDRFLGELKRFGLKLGSHVLDFSLKCLNGDLCLTTAMVPCYEVINTFKKQSDPMKKWINTDHPTCISPHPPRLQRRLISFL